jgi:apolipoprotein N-acyltransferase
MVIFHCILFALLQIPTPSERLSFEFYELVYVALGLGFLFLLPVRTWWRRWLTTLIITQACFVVLHYNLRGDTLSLVSFFLVLLPLAIWGMVSLIRWTVQHLRDAESRTALMLSLVSWGFFSLAYPPLPLGPAGLVLLVPWMIVLLRYTPSRALFGTFWSAVLFNSVSYFWIFNVAKVGPAPAVIGGLFLLICYLSSYFVLATWIFLKIRDKSVGKISLRWLFPFVWVGIEVMRSYGQISFPWSHLGYVLGNHPELLQGLAWIGVYGYTIVLLFSNMILAKAILEKRWILTLVPALILVILGVHGSIVLQRADQRSPTELAKQDGAMRIALVQPSILQTKKWSKGYFDSVITKTWSMMDTLRTDSLDLIVLPETAVPDFLPIRPGEAARFRTFVRKHQVPVMVGALDFDRNGPAPRRYNYYNAAFVFWPSGQVSEFRKTRLVPFSEYLPFSGLLPIVNYVDLGEGDFSPGDTLPTFGRELWTPNICYESIYPDLMRTMIRNGTRLMVNITNDGWFGKTTAPGQHANLIRFRAVESGLPVARCANSGISIFYDAQGRSFERTALFEERITYHTLSLRSTVTFYTRWGDWFEALWAGIFGVTLVTIILAGWGAKKKGQS